jgi:hypothetical protein
VRNVMKSRSSRNNYNSEKSRRSWQSVVVSALVRLYDREANAEGRERERERESKMISSELRPNEQCRQ